MKREITLEKLTDRTEETRFSIMGFLGINDVWKFCSILFNYIALTAVSARQGPRQLRIRDLWLPEPSPETPELLP